MPTFSELRKAEVRRIHLAEFTSQNSPARHLGVNKGT
jgi:hypothetical protein